MGLSLGHGKELDPGNVGILDEQLPHYEQGIIDLRGWFPTSPAPAPGSASSPDSGSKGDENRAGNVERRPIELEIGSGKGTFVLNQAKVTPGVDYIGIEWARAFWRFAADRIRRHCITNVKMVRAEASFFVRNYVEDNLFRQVHIYFPDPWPKKRHNKRRLFQAPFLRELHRALEPNGQIRIATDHADYFEWMEEHAAMVADLFERLPFESPDAAGEGELVGTNFERKYRREGRPFNAMILKRI